MVRNAIGISAVLGFRLASWSDSCLPGCSLGWPGSQAGLEVAQGGDEVGETFALNCHVGA